MTILIAIYISRVYILPIVILLGSTLNLLSYFIMRRMQSKISFYMMILSFVDTGNQKKNY